MHPSLPERSAVSPAGTAGDGFGSTRSSDASDRRSKRLPKANYPRFEVAFHSPAFYYDNSKPMFTYKRAELIVYVRIPVVSGEHLFTVYEVLSFPVPLNMGNNAQKDALQIVDLPAHVAVFYPSGQGVMDKR